MAATPEYTPAEAVTALDQLISGFHYNANERQIAQLRGIRKTLALYVRAEQRSN